MSTNHLELYNASDSTIDGVYGWNGFLSNKSDSFTLGVENLNIGLQKSLDDLTSNPSDPALLAAYQSLLSEYTLYRNAQSNVVKVYKDVGSAIIQNFR